MARRRWNYETIQQVVDGENPFYQSGYTGKDKRIKRKVGDEWTDKKGITWRKTTDGKVRINKQADAIKELVQPKCSKCGARIDFSCDRLDHKVFPKTGKCFDCLVTEETQMRIDGTYDDYEELKILRNKRGALVDFKGKVHESIEYLENDKGVMGDVLETGELVTYTGKCNPQWLIDAKEDFIKVTYEIEKIDEEIKQAQARFDSKTTI
jgi:hypothetical protein